MRLKEQSRLRDEEVEGQWLTEEKLEKELRYSKTLGFKYNNYAFQVLHLYIDCCK